MAKREPPAASPPPEAPSPSSASGPQAAPSAKTIPTQERPGWRRDLWRAAAIVTAASLLGLLANALSRHPVVLLDPQGPGALPEKAPSISAAEYRRLLQRGGLLVLDARSPRLYQKGAPRGGYRVRPETLDRNYAELQAYLESARKVVVICDSATCASGERLVEMLSERGYSGARVFAGGWPAYRAAGLPVERPAR